MFGVNSNVLLSVLIFATGALAASQAKGTAAEIKVRHESIEWCNIWIPDANKDDLPRVLLIGDSITMGYYGQVVKKLEGKAYCARLATSASVCDPAFYIQLQSVLSQYSFEVIHFNSGLHGFDYTEEEYRKGYEKMVRTLREQAKGAKLICATTTPVKPDSKKAYLKKRIDARNAIATEIARRYGITVNDLNKPMEDHPEYYRDNFHYRREAVAIQARQVAEAISKYLPKAKK